MGFETALFAGLIVGLVSAIILHLNYNLLSHRKDLQLAILVGTVFFGLLPNVLFGLVDMARSHAVLYGTANMILSTAYVLGWMLTTFFGFALWHVIRLARKRGKTR